MALLMEIEERTYYRPARGQRQLPLGEYERPAKAVELAELRRHRKRLARSRARRYCRYCGRDVDKKKVEVDHIVPKSRGGSNHPTNLVLCCRECNLSKGSKTPEEWAWRILSVTAPELSNLRSIESEVKPCESV